MSMLEGSPQGEQGLFSAYLVTVLWRYGEFVGILTSLSCYPQSDSVY